MNKLLLVVLIFLLLPAAVHAAPKDPEQLIKYAPVPADPPYQGEVRLLRRDSALVLQTLLNSKLMQRVVRAINNNELRDWPDGREGANDSRRYREELVHAHQVIRSRAGEEQRYLQLLIEFVLDGQKSHVALYAPTLTEEGDRLVLHKKELLKKLPLSRMYIYKNMQFILQENFQLEADGALELMRPVAGNQ